MSRNSQTEKDADKSLELSRALVDFCTGYPVPMSSFALLHAAAVILTVSRSKDAMIAAPGLLKNLIDKTNDLVKRKGL